MGTDLNLPSVESRDTERFTRLILVGVAIAALVAGAAFIGGSAATRGPFEDAAGYIEAFYAEGDAAGLAEVIDTRALPGIVPEQLESQLGGILQPGVTVTDETTATVAGVPVTKVETADGIVWCVTPDGTVLPLCRLGELPLSLPGDPAGFTLDEQFSVGQVFFDGVQLIVGLSLPADAQAVTLAGEPTITAPAGVELELAQQLLSQAGGQPMPVPPGDVTVEPGSVLFLELLTEDPAAATALAADTLTITWGDTEVDLGIGRPTWFLR